MHNYLHVGHPLCVHYEIMFSLEDVLSRLLFMLILLLHGCYHGFPCEHAH